MTKVNLHDHIDKDDLVAHLLIDTLSQTLTGKKFEEFMGEIQWGDKDEFEILLVLEGHEFDIVPTLKYWQSQIDRMVEEKAREILKDELFAIGEIRDDLERSISARFNDRFDIDFDEW